MALTHCRHFSGYKPCGKSDTCDLACSHFEVPQHRLLIVHLGALGAVVRSTALLQAIKRKYPSSHITWMTDKPADQLLRNHPLIDRVLTTTTPDLLALSALEFDVTFNLDKSLVSAGVIAQSRTRQLFGFGVDPRTHAIVPATPASTELWELGLSDYKKFFVNQKSELQLMHEALELGPYLRDEYDLPLNLDERAQVEQRRKAWGREGQILLGLNTGCSHVMPHKKLSVQAHRSLIEALLAQGRYRIVLLGGPEDTIRNQQIGYGFDVIQTATESGLRDGLVSVASCDVVVSGDSLGMHMAIAMRKFVVAWFGPTCAQEIDLFDRGIKLQAHVGCSPCWKRACQKQPMCYDLVSRIELIRAIEQGLQWHLQTSSSRPPLLETHFSPSL